MWLFGKLRLTFHLSTHQPICLAVHLFILLSTDPFIYPLHLSILQMSVLPYYYLLIHPSHSVTIQISSNLIWARNSSAQFSCSVVSDSLRPHGLQHARPPCPSPAPGAYSNSCPSSWWCHPTISSSVVPFSCHLQTFPASGSFPVSQFFASAGHSVGDSASASVPPMNIQDWFPLGWTGWISLQSKRLWRVFSNTSVQKHQFFNAQLSL